MRSNRSCPQEATENTLSYHLRLGHGVLLVFSYVKLNIQEYKFLIKLRLQLFVPISQDFSILPRSCDSIFLLTPPQQTPNYPPPFWGKGPSMQQSSVPVGEPGNLTCLLSSHQSLRVVTATNFSDMVPRPICQLQTRVPSPFCSSGQVLGQ